MRFLDVGAVDKGYDKCSEYFYLGGERNLCVSSYDEITEIDYLTLNRLGLV
jgi:hypothetical protein